MLKTKGYAAQSAVAPLKPWEFERREPGVHDLQIEILYSGVCHSDIHYARNEWGESNYPMVSGHEVVGRVVKIGDKVTNFKVGDRVGVGCMVDSCFKCSACLAGLEQFCEQGYTFIYNDPDKYTGGITYGGFSTNLVVNERFALHIPDAFNEEDLSGVAPLLCAGITTYSPLRHWNIGKGDKVGIAGIGGLGHLAVKFAHALGAQVIAFTTTQEKKKDVLRLNATAGVFSPDDKQMQEYANSLNFILNTIPAAHDLTRYLNLLALDGTMCLVGIPAQPHPGLHPHVLVAKRRSLAGSLIGGIAQTQEMLNFCAQHHITADVEVIAPAQVNQAFDRVVNKDVRYRFVLDMRQA